MAVDPVHSLEAYVAPDGADFSDAIEAEFQEPSSFSPAPLSEPIPDVEDSAPWERMVGERKLDYALFERYLAMGPERRIKDFLKQQHAIEVAGRGRPMGLANRVYRLSSVWKWAERAGAYDEYLSAKERADYEQERRQQRKARQQVLRAYFGILASKLPQLRSDQKTIDWDDATNALRMLVNELRKEYDDTPEQRELAGEGAAEGGVIMAVELQRLLFKSVPPREDR